MPNYLFLLCLICILYRRRLLQWVSFLFLLFSWFFLVVLVFCVYSILFIWILQVGAIVCWKILENDVQILCDHLSYKLYDEASLLFTCFLFNFTHANTDTHRHVGRVNRNCCSYCDDDRNDQRSAASGFYFVLSLLHAFVSYSLLISSAVCGNWF